MVVADEPAGRGEDLAGGAAVLQQRLALDLRDGAIRIPRGSLLEAFLEPLECRVAGAAEAIDGLVVVANDDDVVRLVRPAPDQLQQEDLGHVGVLELVHEHVPELVLVAAQDVGPLGEQLDRQQLLLAEVQQAALAQRRW